MIWKLGISICIDICTDFILRGKNSQIQALLEHLTYSRKTALAFGYDRTAVREEGLQKATSLSCSGRCMYDVVYTICGYQRSHSIYDTWCDHDAIPLSFA